MPETAVTKEEWLACADALRAEHPTCYDQFAVLHERATGVTPWAVSAGIPSFAHVAELAAQWFPNATFRIGRAKGEADRKRVGILLNGMLYESPSTDDLSRDATRLILCALAQLCAGRMSSALDPAEESRRLCALAERIVAAKDAIDTADIREAELICGVEPRSAPPILAQIDALLRAIAPHIEVALESSQRRVVRPGHDGPILSDRVEATLYVGQTRLVLLSGERVNGVYLRAAIEARLQVIHNPIAKVPA